MILKHPAVAEACVVGVPAEEIIAFVGGQMANYKKPKSVDFVQELPKSAYGKILKREARARYWQGRTRAV